MQLVQRSSKVSTITANVVAIKLINSNLRRATAGKKTYASQVSAPYACGSQTRPHHTKNAQTGPERGIPRTPAPPQCRHIYVFYIRPHFIHSSSLQCSRVWANFFLARPNTQFSSSFPLSQGPRARTKMAAKQRQTRKAPPSRTKKARTPEQLRRS